jgi:hypothetical protein
VSDSDHVSDLGLNIGEDAELVRLTVSIAVSGWLGAAPSKLWSETFELSQADARDVLQVIREVPQQIRSEGWPHSLEVTSAYTSWGAYSGLISEVVLLLAGAAADQLLSRVIDSTLKRIRDRRQGQRDAEREPLTRDQAIEFARWFLVDRYSPVGRKGMDFVPGRDDELDHVADGHDIEGSKWTVSFQDHERNEYTITMADRGGLPTPTYVERRSYKENAGVGD